MWCIFVIVFNIYIFMMQTMWTSFGATERAMFMILMSYMFLLFKNSQLIFLLLSLEYLVLGVMFYNLIFGLSFLILFYMVFSVISSVLGLYLFVILIKTFGENLSFL